MDVDWAALYRADVDAVCDLAARLDDERLADHVPAAPAWTVRDVLDHLAGAASDLLTGRMDGAPGPEWTARHVSERTALPLADVLAELARHRDAVAALVAGRDTPLLAWDVAVHHADLHEALGLGVPREDTWAPVVDAVVARRRVAVPAGMPRYEVFRGLFSRRSVAQLRAHGLDPAAAAGFGVFGPRPDDQPVPA